MSLKKMNNDNQVSILRSNRAVGNFFGAFGNSIKETRLTAALAYLIAKEPSPFLTVFRLKGNPTDVLIENVTKDRGRSDIQTRTDKGEDVVIEAKIAYENCSVRAPLTQNS